MGGAHRTGSIKEKAANARETFSHSLFNLDNEDDEFDLDFDTFEKSDIFKIDGNKNKKKEKLQEENRFDDLDDDDMETSYSSKKNKKHIEEDSKPRHKNFDDEEGRQPLFVSRDKGDKKGKKEREKVIYN